MIEAACDATPIIATIAAILFGLDWLERRGER